MFDVVLIIIIGIFGLLGFWNGLVHAVCNLLGTIVGLFLASRYYEPVADWIIQKTGWSVNLSKIFIFILAFILVARLVGFAFWLLQKMLGFLTKMPFLRSLNHILGLVFGLIEGALIVGICLYFISRFPVPGGITDAIYHSQVAPTLVNIVSALAVLMPYSLRALKSSIEGIM